MAEHIPGKHFLLPYERHEAAKVVARLRAHPDRPSGKRYEQNYGLEGTALIVASMAARIYSFPVLTLGLVLMFVSSLKGPVAVVAYLLIGTAVAMGVLGIVRGIQAGRVGRRHRGGRPFVRP